MANSHDVVAHNWAHQTGRKTFGFNMYYDGETIYSYGRHFPLARHFVAPNGETVILFNRESRSVSTSKHQSIVRRAIGYGDSRVVELTSGDLLDHPTPERAARAIYWLQQKNLEIAQTWKRARTQKDWHAERLAANVATINRLRELFQLTMPVELVPDDIAAFAAFVAEWQKAEQRARELREREAIRDWLSGEKDTAPHTRQVYVRVKNGELQSSWGIRVPLRRALALYRLANHCAKCQHEYLPRKAQTIDQWRIERISADGTIKAGCHILPLKIQKLAAKIAGLERA